MSDGEQARERADEIAQQLQKPMQATTAESLELAEKRLEQARERTRSARRKSARAHQLAAEAHEEAAAMRVGDVQKHLDSAAEHRAARDEDYRAADHETH